MLRSTLAAVVVLAVLVAPALASARGAAASVDAPACGHDSCDKKVVYAIEEAEEEVIDAVGACCVSEMAAIAALSSKVTNASACCVNSSSQVAGVAACCANVSSQVSSVSSQVSSVSACCANVSSQVSALSSELEQCTPIYAIPPGGLVVTAPGCYRVKNDLPCSLVGVACVTVLSHGVTVYGGGFDLALGPNTTGFVLSSAPTFTLSSLRVINDPPSNLPANIGMIAHWSSGLTLQRVTFNGSCTGAEFFDCDTLRIEHCAFTEIKHIDSALNFVTPLVISGGDGIRLTDTDFTHVDGSPALSANWSGAFEDNAIVIEVSLVTHLPPQGVTIRNVNVVDGTHVFAGQMDGFTIEGLHVVATNPNGVSSMLELPSSGFTSLGPRPGLVKDSSFFNANANPFADGIICSRVLDVTFDNVDVFINAAAGQTPNNTGVPGAAQYMSGAIRVQHNYVGAFVNKVTTFFPPLSGGVVIKNSHLRGALVSTSTQRQNIGVFVDGRAEHVSIIDTVIENMGGYIPANASAGVPQVPGGGIVVAPPGSNVFVTGCKIYSSGNGVPQGGNGILFMGAQNVTTIPGNGGSPGTTLFPPTSNCTAIDNQLFFNAGCAIWNDGVDNYIYDNRQGGNWGGAYCGSGSFAPVVLSPGAPTLAGYNI